MFDILFVLGYFRLAASFLSVVRYLAPKMRIGIVRVPTEAALREKTGEAEEKFLRLCAELGAEIVSPGTPVRTRLLVVQQFPYDDRVASQIRINVKSDRTVGLMALATAGLEPHDRFLQQFDVRRVYVPSRRFMGFLLDRRRAQERYAGVDVEEVGLPFARYPVFPEFGVDWMIAAPTLFSFSNEAGKQAFLSTVITLLRQIPDSDMVAYKPHNGNALDYFAPRFHYATASALRALPRSEVMLETAAKSGPDVVRHHAGKTLTSALYRRVLDRAVTLGDLTPYADISLEAFLPGVRKGVLGGLSNTIWGTVYFGLPFFNCIDPSLRNGTSDLLAKESRTLLDVNLQYFGVPYCEGSLARGSRGESIVSDTDRRGDLLRTIQQDLS